MKNIVFQRILIIFIASAIFISCSKDSLSPNEMASDAKAAPAVPVPNYGTIIGQLSPLPSYAALKLYNEFEDIIVSGFVNPDGTFRVNVISGTYRVVVKYTPNGTPPGEYSYHEIRGVMVYSDKVTDLGVINLFPQ